MNFETPENFHPVIHQELLPCSRRDSISRQKNAGLPIQLRKV